MTSLIQTETRVSDPDRSEYTLDPDPAPSPDVPDPKPCVNIIALGAKFCISGKKG